MKIEYHRKFIKTFAKLPLKIKYKFYERLKMFEQDRSTNILNNHSVGHIYPGWWSINITGDIRALYEEISPDSMIFMKIGTHSELY